MQDSPLEEIMQTDELKIDFDSKALNGLRGFAAVHILVFHSFYFSTLKWVINLGGTVST